MVGVAGVTEPRPEEQTALLQQQQQRQPRTSRSAFVLFFVFGTSCWVAVNFVFVEVPLLIDASFPDVGQMLTVYIVCCLQAANIVPLLYVVITTLAASFRRKKPQHQQKQRGACCSPMAQRAVLAAPVLLLNVLCCVVFAALPLPMPLWTFVLLCVLAGLAATSSSVVLLPFGALYPPAYTPAITAGNTCTALIAGALALVQQPGERNTISFGAFMGIAAALAVLACAAFVALLTVPKYRRLLVRTKHTQQQNIQQKSSCDEEETDEERKHKKQRATRVVASALSQMFLQSFVENGVVMGISSFSLLPYGALHYTVATACSFVLGPFAALLPSALPNRVAGRFFDSTAYVLVSSIVYVSCCAYMVVVSTINVGRTAPFLGITVGGAVVCAARITLRGLTQIGLVRCWTVLHGGSIGGAIPAEQREQGSRLGGLSIQLGALFGAIASMLLALFVWNSTATSSSSSSWSSAPSELL